MTDLHTRIAELCDAMDEANPGMDRTLAVNNLGRTCRENTTEILAALRIAERVMDEDWLWGTIDDGEGGHRTASETARAIIAALKEGA